MSRRILRAALLLIGILGVCSGVVLGLVFLEVKRAEAIKTRYGYLLGSPASLLSQRFRPPDRVERLAPFTYQTATGVVTARYEPYTVWIYYLSPGKGELRVLIDDKSDRITRFKGPWD